MKPLARLDGITFYHCGYSDRRGTLHAYTNSGKLTLFGRRVRHYRAIALAKMTKWEFDRQLGFDAHHVSGRDTILTWVEIEPIWTATHRKM